MQTHYTLTSAAGHFIFPKGTPLGRAKLVRDTITAGSRGTIPHTPRPRPGNAQAWMQSHVAGPICTEISFEWRQI